MSDSAIRAGVSNTFTATTTSSTFVATMKTLISVGVRPSRIA